MHEIWQMHLPRAFVCLFVCLLLFLMIYVQIVLSQFQNLAGPTSSDGLDCRLCCEVTFAPGYAQPVKMSFVDPQRDYFQHDQHTNVRLHARGYQGPQCGIFDLYSKLIERMLFVRVIWTLNDRCTFVIRPAPQLARNILTSYLTSYIDAIQAPNKNQKFTLRLSCKLCVHLCVYMLNQFQKIHSVLCLCTPVSPSVSEMQGIHATGGQPFLRMYLWWSLCTLYLYACRVRVTVGHSGLCCGSVTYFER